MPAATRGYLINKTLLIMIVVNLLFQGCHQAEGSNKLNQLKKVLTGQTFTLKPGEAAYVQNEEVMVIFENVLEDSRCPTQVICDESGEARISLIVTRTGVEPTTVELSTLEGRDRANAINYLIQLKSLKPYPQNANEKIPLTSYVATLVIFVR